MWNFLTAVTPILMVNIIYQTNKVPLMYETPRQLVG
jgi:hypothetical protein